MEIYWTHNCNAVHFPCLDDRLDDAAAGLGNINYAASKTDAMTDDTAHQGSKHF
jgi:hypothetical protein